MVNYIILTNDLSLKVNCREGRDVISVCCMKNDVGNVMSDADGIKDIWRIS